MKLYLKNQPYQARTAETGMMSGNTDAASTSGVKRIYLKPGVGASVPASFPSAPVKTVAPTPTPTSAPSAKIPAAQTFNIARALTSGGVMPSGVERDTDKSTPWYMRTATKPAIPATDAAAIGQYGKGNIDLYRRPQYRYDDGSIATVRSMSFNEDGQEILIPTIAFDNHGKAVELTDEEAIDLYHKTGKYLGKFKTVWEADDYAEQLHRAQDYYYNRRGAKSLDAWRNVPEPAMSETEKVAHDLTNGANHTQLVNLPAALGDYANAVRNTSAARGIRQALRAERSGKTDNTRYGQYLSLMTPEEREKATRLEIDGGLSEEERGAYVRSLNLDERIRKRNDAGREKLIETLESNVGFASASKNAAGERYAKWAAGNDVVSGRGEIAPVPGNFSVLTKKQRDTFKAYADAGDFEAVANYYDALKPSLDAKYAESQKKAFQGLTENSTAAAVASVPIGGALNAFGGIPGYLATAGHVLKDAATGDYTPIDKNSEWHQIPRITQAMDEGRNQRIDKSIENPTARFIAKTASSGISSGLSNLIQLATGQALGLQGRALTEFITTTMSASAGGQAAYRNLEQGQSNGDAFLNATANAAIEYWTEHMTTSMWIENLGKIKSGKLSKADFAKMISAQTGAEMWEEVVGNVADQTWDRTWNGENSEFAQRTRDLMSNAGLSREDAETQAFKELYVNQSVEAALSVAFSMILMDGVPAVSNHVSFAETGRTLRKSGGAETVDNEIEKGLLFDKDSPAHKQAVKVRDRWDSGKGRVNDRELGRLSFFNAQEEAALVSDLGDGGTAAQYYARSLLEATRNNPLDKLSADSIRTLQNIREATRNPSPLTEQERTERESRLQSLTDSIGRIDLDAAGNPLVSYTEAVREIRERLPNATDEQIRRIYSQYRDDTRTVLFGGHRLTRTQFQSLMQEATPETLSKVNLGQLFNQAILDTLDGSDAYDRYLSGATERKFSIDENGVSAESSENAPQSATNANADADTVLTESAIDEGSARNETDDLPFVWNDEASQAAESADADNAPLSLGLLRDDYTETALSPMEFARIDTAARLLGVSVRFADSIPAGTGEANGLYRNGAVLIERDNKNPVLKILGHEWTHHIQKAAPEAYQRFMNSIADEIRDSAAVIRQQYEKSGVTLTEAESMDEAAANYAGKLMTDGTIADEFIDRHIRDRSLLEKVRDAIADTLERVRRSIANLGGRIRAAAKGEDTLQAYREARQQEQRAREILDRFNAALDATVENARSRQDAQNETAVTEDDGKTQFAIKTTDSGMKYVQADRQVIFGNNPRSWGEQVENYINGKIRNGQDVQLITDDGDTLLLTKDTAGKASSAYKPDGIRLSDSEYETKINAEAHIDELAQVSKRGVTRSDTGNIHGDFASRGWNYRTAYFQDFDGKYYQLRISVAQGRNGDVVYNIGDIRERSLPTAHKASTGSSADGGAQSGKTSSANNITHSAEKSKGRTKFSLKGTEDADEIAALRRNQKDTQERLNEVLRQRDNLHRQFRRSDPMKAEIPQAEAERVAKQILRDYYSDMDPATLGAALKETSEWMIRTDGTGSVSTWDVETKLRYAQDKLMPFVEDMLESAWARDTDADAEEWTDIKSRLHNTRLTISQSDAHDIPGYGDFVQHNKGRVNIGVDRPNSTPVDVFYHEMSEQYPSYFPAEITAVSDQLLHMAGLWEDFAEVWDNPFQRYLNDTDFKLYVVNDMLNRMVEAEERAMRPTYADRQAERLRQSREEARERVSRVRSEKNAAMDKQRQKQRERHQESMSKLRQEKNAKIERIRREGIRAAEQVREEGRRQRKEAVDRLKAQYKEKALNWALRKYDSAERQRLLKVAQRLSKMKADAVTRATIDSIVGNLDTVAVSLTGQSLDELVNLRRFYQDKSDKNSPRYDPDFIPDEGTLKRLDRLERRQISDLTLDEVRDLTNVLLNLEHELQTNKRLLSRDERIDIYQAGNQTIRDIEASEGVKGDFLSRQIDRKFVTQTLSPIREIRRMIGYRDDNPLLQRAYALDDGQRVMLDYQMRAEAPFRKFAEDKSFRRRFSGKDAETIEITATRKTGERDGHSVYEDVTVQITPAMRVAIYCLSRDNDGLRHMRDGGLTIPDMTLYRKGDLEEAYNQGVTVKLTPSQARKAVSGMTVQDTHFANLIHAYYNGQSRNEINRTSELLKGYSIAGNENYYPIHVDQNFLKVDFETLKHDGTIEGMGFLKERETRASQPIMLRDADAELEQSIRMHSRYVGLAVPVRDFMKIWNVTTYGVDENGERVSYENSVKQAVKRKWGESGFKYVEKLMTDINTGGRHEVSEWGQLFGKLRSNYAGAVLTLNAGVAFKQAASYPTAAAVLGTQPLLLAMKDFGAVDLDLIAKYTPLQWYRSLGYSTRELGDMARHDKSLPALLNWVQGADLLTTRKLWKASEYYVRLNQKTLKQGTESYYRAVADIYNRVIEETQPNYTVMQRPQMLRSDDIFSQTFGMFKTQPFQNFNILYDSYKNLRAKQSQAKAGIVTESDVKTASRDFGRAVYSQLLQLAVFAAMTIGWAKWRDRDEKYRDEDGQIRLLRGWALEMCGGLLSDIPGGSDLWEFASSKLFGQKYYGMEITATQVISDTATSLDKLGKAVSDAMGKLIRGEEPDVKSLIRQINSSANDLTKLFGVPYQNGMNLFLDLTRNLQKLFRNSADVDYDLTKWAADPKKSAYDLLFQTGARKFYPDPESGNVPENYRALYRQMLQDGFEESDIQNKMKDRWMKTPDYLKRYNPYAGLLTGTALASPAYARLDEAHRKELGKVIKAAAKYETFRDYAEGYQATSSEKWIAEAMDLNRDYEIPLPDLLILRAGKSGVEALKETDRNGNEVAIDDSKGLQIMEIAYRLFPEMERWDSKKRRAVLEWLDVGKTLLRYDSDAVSAKLERMRKQ